jgi:hypothetical protein
MDMNAFAKDLCAALGGSGVEYKPENDHFAKVRVGDNVLDLYCPYYADKVKVGIHAAEIPETESRNLYCGNTAEASVNPDARPIKQIAADIQRRVIDASAETLAAQRAAFAKNQGSRASLATRGARLETLGLLVRPENDGLRLSVATNGAPYLKATVSDEGVRIERMTSEIPFDKFIKILAIINQ